MSIPSVHRPAWWPHLKERLLRIGALPEVDGRSAVERFARHRGIPVEEVAIGSGTTQLIYDLPRALGSRRVLIVGPTYADYRDGCLRNKVDCDFWLAREEKRIPTGHERYSGCPATIRYGLCVQSQQS